MCLCPIYPHCIDAKELVTLQREGFLVQKTHC